MQICPNLPKPLREISGPVVMVWCICVSGCFCCDNRTFGVGSSCRQKCDMASGSLLNVVNDKDCLFSVAVVSFLLSNFVDYCTRVNVLLSHLLLNSVVETLH